MKWLCEIAPADVDCLGRIVDGFIRANNQAALETIGPSLVAMKYDIWCMRTALKYARLPLF